MSFFLVQVQSSRNRIVVAVYNYQSREESDVSFLKGDRMEVLDDRYVPKFGFLLSDNVFV